MQYNPITKILEHIADIELRFVQFL